MRKIAWPQCLGRTPCRSASCISVRSCEKYHGYNRLGGHPLGRGHACSSGAAKNITAAMSGVASLSVGVPHFLLARRKKARLTCLDGHPPGRGPFCGTRNSTVNMSRAATLSAGVPHCPSGGAKNSAAAMSGPAPLSPACSSSGARSSMATRSGAVSLSVGVPHVLLGM